MYKLIYIYLGEIHETYFLDLDSLKWYVDYFQIPPWSWMYEKVED